jgi:hypothetical protein
MLLLVTAVSAASNTLVIPDVTASPGSEVAVAVQLQEASGIGGLMFDVSYGTSVLAFTRADPGSLAGDAVMEAREVEPGVIAIAIASGKGITGSGTLVTLRFTDIGGQDSATSLTPAVIQAYDTNGENVTIQSQQGSVAVRSASPFGTPDRGSTNGTPKETSLDCVPVCAGLAAVIVLAGRKRRK